MTSMTSSAANALMTGMLCTFFTAAFRNPSFSALAVLAALAVAEAPEAEEGESGEAAVSVVGTVVLYRQFVFLPSS